MSLTFCAAGHKFEYTPAGLRCTLIHYDTGLVCDAPWSLIGSATEADIDTPGWAHTGVLNVGGLAQIVMARAHEQYRIWESVIDAASAGAR